MLTQGNGFYKNMVCLVTIYQLDTRGDMSPVYGTCIVIKYKHEIKNDKFRRQNNVCNDNRCKLLF